MTSALSPLRERNENGPGASWTAASQLNATPLKLGSVDEELKKLCWLDELDGIPTIIKVRDINTKNTGEFLASFA